MNTTELFGRYALGQRLAGHVFAEVYVARVDLPGGGTRALAIKRTLPEVVDEAIGNAMLEPAAKAAQLLHPNIVALFELGRQNGQAFVAMELVEGPSLAQLLEAARRAKLAVPAPVQLHIVLGCARAVAAAHALRKEGEAGPRQPLVHGGLSPSNVLVGVDGVVKVTDFGLTPTALDSTTVPLGYYRSKLPYNPPERFLGEPVTELADVYGLGLLLFELAVGRPAFAAKTDAQMIRAVCEEPAQQPRKLNKQISEGLDKLIGKAMARKPAQRQKSAEALVKELEGLLPRDARDGAPLIAAFVSQVEKALGESLGPRSDEIVPRTATPLPAIPTEPSEPPASDLDSPFAEVTAPPPPEPPAVPPALANLFDDEDEDAPSPPAEQFSFSDDKTVADLRIEDVQARLAELAAESAARAAGGGARADEPSPPEASFSDSTVVTQLPVAELTADTGVEPLGSSPTVDVIADAFAAAALPPADPPRSSFSGPTATLTPEEVAALPKANGGGSPRPMTDFLSVTEMLSPEQAAGLAAATKPVEPRWRQWWARLRPYRWWLVWGASALALVGGTALLVVLLDEDDPHVTRVESLSPDELARLTGGGVVAVDPVTGLPAATDVEPPPTAAVEPDEPAEPAAADEPSGGEVVAGDDEPDPGSTEARPASFGVVLLSCDPPAEIIVRGKKFGVTPKELRLPAGTYRVTLVNEAERLQRTIKVAVKAGGRSEEKVKLGPADAMAKPPPAKAEPPAKAPPAKAEPAKEPPAKEPVGESPGGDAVVGGATLVITAKPWADVYIDGIKVGTTPLPPIPIAPGNHTIDLDNPELGKSKRMPIKVKAGKAVKLKVDLTK